MLLGIDVGTTHCKAGVFRQDGTALTLASLATPVKNDAYYDPEAVWQVVRQVITHATQGLDVHDLAAVGVTSMAETGVLLEVATGQPRTDLIPWHNKIASGFVRKLTSDPAQRFTVTGLRPNFKAPLAKILWLQAQNPALLSGAIWLSAADYIVYRLTGTMVTDYSLAGRTYAFRLDEKRWDADYLAQFGISTSLFPKVKPSGTPFAAESDLLAPGTPVAVAGHDHVCAALAVGAVQPEIVLDSMGTAETLVGVWTAPALTEREYESGLLFGCHVVPDQHYWMGSLSASGGSIEWLRALFGDLSYDMVDHLLAQVEAPTGVLYFPYLTGSSGNSQARAAFIGLDQAHQQAHLLKAVVEGTAYEIEHLRRTVNTVLSIGIQRMIAVGGGTRSAAWMQVKADVSGCEYHLHPVAEATLLGAAVIAGMGSHVYASVDDALTQIKPQTRNTVLPQGEKHQIYRRLFEEGYLKLLLPVREYQAERFL